MRAFLSAAALTLVVALAACRSASSGLSDADKAAIRSAVQKYVETVNAQNVDGWLQLVSDNAVFMPLNHAPVEGRKAIGEWERATMKSQGPNVLSATPAEIDGRGDVAFTHGAYSLTLNGANAGTGNYMAIWRKQADGAWRISRQVWNTNTEAPLEGVWKVAEIVVTGAGASNIANPQPSLFVFTKGYYSQMFVQGNQPRTLFKAEEPTNQEKIPAFDSFVANTGTYEVAGSTLTIRPIVARYPNFMAGGSDKYEFRIEGNTLFLTEKSTDQTSRVGQRVVPSSAPLSDTRLKLTRLE